MKLNEFFIIFLFAKEKYHANVLRGHPKDIVATLIAGCWYNERRRKGIINDAGDYHIGRTRKNDLKQKRLKERSNNNELQSMD